MRRIVRIVMVLYCISLLAISVNAHPGRTDGSGGHKRSSTGEYHYHHGQPEHQHYDMDGDGDIDCPYDFEDVTDSSRKRSPDSKVDDTVESELVPKLEKKYSFFSIIDALFASVPLSLVICIIAAGPIFDIFCCFLSENAAGKVTIVAFCLLLIVCNYYIVQFLIS